MRTEIPAQDLGSALQMLAQSRDLQVLYFSELVKDVRTGGASGELTVEEALTQLLSGTGLTFRFVDDRAITILPVTTSQPPASPPEARHGSFWSRLRLAQSGTSASQGNAGDAPSVVNASTDSAPARETQVEEIVVTGTHIRQVEKPTSPIFTYDRAAIDRTGYTNVQDFIQSLPQNFTGGAL
ncbi:MAG TPA: STN domain-containing protein, partial [Steroidobacteraceae bacterium]